MMATQKTQVPLFVRGFDLGSRVRLDHPLRKVKEAIDFSFVRSEVAGCYGYNGNEPVDPEVILKMMFLLFFEDIKSERLLMGLIEQHERHTGSTVETVVGDSKYGTVENFRACKQRGIRTHMADLSATQQGTGRRKGIFADDAFVYDASSDTFTCPARQTLRRRRHKKKRRAYEYTAGPKVCGACPLREQCTRSKAGRTVKRHDDQELIDAARAEARSPCAKRDRLRRKHLMEGSFADAANNHHFKRSRWRGRWRQQIQEWLIAAAQNIRILLRHGPTRASGVLSGPRGLLAFVFPRVLRPAGGSWTALWPVQT
jgi:hypothetical protein